MRSGTEASAPCAAAFGPVLFTAFGAEASGAWSRGAVPLALVALGSFQALMDFELAMPLWAQCAQVAAFCALGGHSAFGEPSVPVVASCAFLATLKVAMRWCFSPRRWGRCFSPTEGLFWSQVVALAATSMLLGYLEGFAPWSSFSVFSFSLTLFGVLFVALTGSANAVLSRSRWQKLGLASLAPVLAASLTLLLFLVWLTTGVPAWRLHSPSEPPIGWLYRTTTATPAHRQILFVQWPIALAVGLSLIHALCGRSAPGAHVGAAELHRVTVMRRKTFHVLAAVLFLPPIIAGRAAFLGFAQLSASLLFVVVETFRICDVPGVSPALNAFVGRYLDRREDTARGDLVLTHLYLLVGCALPVWLEAPAQDAAQWCRPWAIVRLASGVLLVGVGDACAAVVGVNVGRTRWPGSHRTVEGSAGFVLGVLVVAATLMAIATRLPLCAGSDGGAADLGGIRQVLAFVASTMLSAIFEVYTGSIDNLILPLYFCPLLRALGGPLP